MNGSEIQLTKNSLLFTKVTYASVTVYLTFVTLKYVRNTVYKSNLHRSTHINVSDYQRITNVTNVNTVLINFCNVFLIVVLQMLISVFVTFVNLHIS